MKTCIVLLVFLSQWARAEFPPAAVCFSPDQHCEVPLARFISSAKHTLDIAIYDINEPGIVAAIKAAAARGVAVRIAYDKKQAAGCHSAIPELAKRVPVRYGHQKGIMHDKFSIVDGVALETGSFNYTTHASVANQENQLYENDAQVVEFYLQRFEKIWSSAIPFPP